MVSANIVKDILSYIGQDRYSNWYVGIATDPEDRLFNQHNVKKNAWGWIYCHTSTERDARDTEEFLLKEYLFKGDTGGGDRPCSVYAYKITPTTIE